MVINISSLANLCRQFHAYSLSCQLGAVVEIGSA